MTDAVAPFTVMVATFTHPVVNTNACPLWIPMDGKAGLAVLVTLTGVLFATTVMVVK